METLLSISFAVLAGLFFSRLTKRFRLPNVTAYLIAGVLIGPFVLGRLHIPGIGFATLDSVKSFTLFSETALGFIAFAIGNEFRVSQLRKNGRQATVIGIVQALVATLLVDGALIGLHFILGEDKLPLSAAITLGAVAAATAPAATLMVVRQYKAKGPLTSILLPIVALDDAVGLVVFSVSLGIAKTIQSGQVNLAAIILEPLLEVVLSLGLGFVAGILFSLTEKFFDSNSKRLSLSITFVLLTVALSKLEFTFLGLHVAFSSLLVCMMMGTVFCNVCNFSGELMAKTDKWTAPLFVLFFVLSGAELELNVFLDLAIVGIGAAYIIFRSLGKILGASFSAKAVGCEPAICKHLGITLLPQAGVALGMSLSAQCLGAPGELVRNITLFSVLVYELVGPLMTRDALIKAGEIKPKAQAESFDDEDE